MRIKRKNGLKVAAITIALLLCLALAIGITGAFYQAKRQATGTLSMDQGIIIDYKGFNGSETGETWERGTTFELFSTEAGEVQPGAHIKVNAASIKANAKSVNFYARVKLSYKFYNGETLLYDSNATTGNVEGFKPSDLIKTSKKFFGDNWVESADGYFYYGSGTTLNTFTKASTTFVDLFATDAKFIIEGEGFTLENGDLEGGGFVVGETSINKIEVFLTLETLQGGTGSTGDTGSTGGADVEAEGWEITEVGVTTVQLNKEDYTLDTSGNYTPTNSFVNKYPQYAFKFILNNPYKIAKITGVVGAPTKIKIPNKLTINNEEYVVQSVENNAFRGCISLTSIDIPDSVKSIGEYAFYNCIKLNSVTIGNGSETTIGEYAFLMCTKLNSVQIGNSVKSIGVGAFQQCSSLTSITIPESVTSIGEFAFNETELISINIPKSVTSIGKGAFSGCGAWNKEIVSSLTSITVKEGNIKYHSESNCLIERASKTLIAGCKTSVIPSSVTSIGDCAFLNCYSLTSIDIPDSVTSIGSDAFRGCKSLTSINIPDSVTSIGFQAFAVCSSLTSINIPDKVISIGEGAFMSSKNLKSVTIGSGVTKIPNSCFAYCSTLEKVVIKGKIMTSIGNDVFKDCKNLKMVLLNKDSTVKIVANGLTKLDGTFDENGNLITDGSGSFFKYAK